MSVSNTDHILKDIDFTFDIKIKAHYLLPPEDKYQEFQRMHSQRVLDSLAFEYSEELKQELLNKIKQQLGL